MPIGKAIAIAREKRGLNQSDLARAVGVTPQAVQKWESGGGPRQSRLQSIADALKMSLSEMLAGTEELSNLYAEAQGNSSTPPRPIRTWDNEDELDDRDVVIRDLVVNLSAGPGKQMFEIDYKGRGRVFQRDYIEGLGLKPECAATMRVSGNSMEPRLWDGDSVLVDYCRQTILDGKIYAFVWLGEHYIKRVFKEPGGGLRLVSNNTDKSTYPDRIIPPEHIDEFSLIGEVVGLAGGKI